MLSRWLEEVRDLCFQAWIQTAGWFRSHYRDAYLRVRRVPFCMHYSLPPASLAQRRHPKPQKLRLECHVCSALALINVMSWPCCSILRLFNILQWSAAETFSTVQTIKTALAEANYSVFTNEKKKNMTQYESLALAEIVHAQHWIGLVWTVTSHNDVTQRNPAMLREFSFSLSRTTFVDTKWCHTSGLDLLGDRITLKRPQFP